MPSGDNVENLGVLSMNQKCIVFLGIYVAQTWWVSGRLQLILATKEMKKKRYQPIIDLD